MKLPDAQPGHAGLLLLSQGRKSEKLLIKFLKFSCLHISNQHLEYWFVSDFLSRMASLTQNYNFISFTFGIWRERFTDKLVLNISNFQWVVWCLRNAQHKIAQSVSNNKKEAFKIVISVGNLISSTKQGLFLKWRKGHTKYFTLCLFLFLILTTYLLHLMVVFQQG